MSLAQLDRRAFRYGGARCSFRAEQELADHPVETRLGLATSDDQYLKAYATFRYGLAEMNRERFEDAAANFQKVLNEWGRYVGCDIESAFYIAVCYGQMREKEKAIVSATRFLEDYPDAPERWS